jgi:hypothetical protein
MMAESAETYVARVHTNKICLLIQVMFDSVPTPFGCCQCEPYEGDGIQNLIQAKRNHEIRVLRGEGAELPISRP